MEVSVRRISAMYLPYGTSQKNLWIILGPVDCTKEEGLTDNKTSVTVDAWAEHLSSLAYMYAPRQLTLKMVPFHILKDWAGVN